MLYKEKSISTYRKNEYLSSYLVEMHISKILCFIVSLPKLTKSLPQVINGTTVTRTILFPQHKCLDHNFIKKTKFIRQNTWMKTRLLVVKKMNMEEK